MHQNGHFPFLFYLIPFIVVGRFGWVLPNNLPFYTDQSFCKACFQRSVSFPKCTSACNPKSSWKMMQGKKKLIFKKLPLITEETNPKVSMDWSKEKGDISNRDSQREMSRNKPEQLDVYLRQKGDYTSGSLGEPYQLPYRAAEATTPEVSIYGSCKSTLDTCKA